MFSFERVIKGYFTWGAARYGQGNCEFQGSHRVSDCDCLSLSNASQHYTQCCQKLDTSCYGCECYSDVVLELLLTLDVQFLQLQAPPQKQAHDEAAERNEHWIGVSPLIKNRGHYIDFITAQVKVCVWCFQVSHFDSKLPADFVVRRLRPSRVYGISSPPIR